MNECSLCTAETLELFYCTNKHGICQDCQVGETKAALDEGRRPVCRAMDDTICAAEYDSGSLISSLLSQKQVELVSRLDEFLLHLELAKQFKCFKCGTKYHVELYDDSVQCINCKSECCPRCELEFHKNLNCHENLKQEKARPKVTKEQEKMTEIVVIRCHCNPDRPLVKEANCNKLKCPTCPLYWCWYCKKKIPDKNAYDHFKKDPKHRYGTEQGTCELWVEPKVQESSISTEIECQCESIDCKQDGNLSFCGHCFKATCNICDALILNANPYVHFDRFGGSCQFIGHPTDILIEKAEKGDTNAQLHLGLLYQFTVPGVKRDTTKAQYYFQKAIDGGDIVNGTYFMAMLLVEESALLGHVDSKRMWKNEKKRLKEKLVGFRNAASVVGIAEQSGSQSKPKSQKTLNKGTLIDGPVFAFDKEGKPIFEIPGNKNAMRPPKKLVEPRQHGNRKLQKYLEQDVGMRVDTGLGKYRDKLGPYLNDKKGKRVPAPVVLAPIPVAMSAPPVPVPIAHVLLPFAGHKPFVFEYNNYPSEDRKGKKRLEEVPVPVEIPVIVPKQQRLDRKGKRVIKADEIPVQVPVQVPGPIPNYKPVGEFKFKETADDMKQRLDMLGIPAAKRIVSDPEPEPSKPSKRQRPVKEVIEIPDYIPPKRKPSNQSNPIIID